MCYKNAMVKGHDNMISVESKNNIIIAVEIAVRTGRIITRNGTWWERKKIVTLDIIVANRTQMPHNIYL